MAAAAAGPVTTACTNDNIGAFNKSNINDDDDDDDDGDNDEFRIIITANNNKSFNKLINNMLKSQRRINVNSTRMSGHVSGLPFK
jgi:hypothetical protein